MLICGLNGTCRGCELTNLSVKNLKDDGKELRIQIYIPKTKEWKEYIIFDEFAKIVREYMSHRPKHATSDRLFLQWRKGKCVNQNMGKHSIAKIPKEVATFLGLPDPSSYTGHSYRRTGATIAVEEGSTMDEVKRIGPWKSTKTAEGYIQESLSRKRKVAKMFSNAIGLPSTSSIDENEVQSMNRDQNVNATNANQELSKSASFGSGFTDNVDANPITSAEAEVATRRGGGEMSKKAGSERSVVPVSVEVKTSPSEFTVASVGKTITISGLEKSQPTQTASKENITFHFSGECSNITIINMK